jgi:hypothetical protein
LDVETKVKKNINITKIFINIEEGDFRKAQESNLVFSKVCKELCSKKNDLSKMIIIDKKQ